MAARLLSGLLAHAFHAPEGAPQAAPAAQPPPPPPAAPPAAAAPPAPAATPPNPPAPAAAPPAAPPANPPTAAPTGPKAGDTGTPQPSSDGKSQPSNAAPSGADAGKKNDAAASAAAPAVNSAPPDAPKPLLGGEEAPPPAEIDLGKLPEGVLAEDKQQAAFKALCKELGLDSAKAQKLIGFSHGLQVEANKAAEAQAVKDFNQGLKQLQDKLRTDPDFGGQSFDANLKIANGMLSHKSIPQDVRAELRAFFARRPDVASEPSLVKAFWHLGKTASEDSVNGTVAQNNGVNEGTEPGVVDIWSDKSGGLYEGKMGAPSTEVHAAMPPLPTPK